MVAIAAPCVVVAGVSDGAAEGIVSLPRGLGQHVTNRQGAVDVVKLQDLAKT